MVETKTVAFAAVLVVMAAFIAPYASPTGFATVSGCTGTPVLSLTPNIVQTGSGIVARVGGLNTCAGQQIQLKKDSCYGSSVATLTCTDSKCSNPIGFTVDTARQDYLIYACLDSYGDGRYWRASQTSAANLKVVSLPDVKVKSIVAPKYIPATSPFNVEVILENTGVLAAGGVDYKIEFYKLGAVTPFKTVTNVGESTAAPVIAAGSEYKIKVPLSFGSGTYSVKAIADPVANEPNGRIIEWDENNNQLSLEFTVG